MGRTTVKTMRYELELDDDGTGVTTAILSVPFSTTRYKRELLAVRLMFAPGQDHELGSCSAKLFLRNADNPSGQGVELYSTGELEDGEIPDGGVDPIDLNPADSAGLLWNDSLGEHRRPFEVNTDQVLWLDLQGVPASGAGTSTLIFEADCEQEIG